MLKIEIKTINILTTIIIDGIFKYLNDTGFSITIFLLKTYYFSERNVSLNIKYFCKRKRIKVITHLRLLIIIKRKIVLGKTIGS